jgi:hypothetical protein
MVKVIAAHYLEAFKLQLSLRTTDDQTQAQQIFSGNIDLKDYIMKKSDHGIFAPLKEKSYFRQFSLNANTIEWQNGADIAPERLLTMMQADL